MNDILDYIIDKLNMQYEPILNQVITITQEDTLDNVSNSSPLTIDKIIENQKRDLNISYIKELSSKYDVIIWENCYSFLLQLESIDNRNKKELIQEKITIEKKNYKASKHRYDLLNIIKYASTGYIEVKTRGSEKIKLNDEIYCNFIATSLLNKLYIENKSFYCGALNWDEDTKTTVSLSDIEMLQNAENTFIMAYDKLEDPEKELAIKIKTFANYLHNIEYITDNIRRHKYDFKLKEYDDSWANTKKASFIVDVLVYYQLLPSHFIKDKPQNKFQYIKRKLKQANTIMQNFTKSEE